VELTFCCHAKQSAEQQSKSHNAGADRQAKLIYPFSLSLSLSLSLRRPHPNEGTLRPAAVTAAAAAVAAGIVRHSRDH